MQAKRNASRRGLGVLALLLCGGLAHAQDAGSVPAGSESYVVTTRSLATGATETASASYSIVGTVGCTVALRPAASTSYGLAGGPASAPAGLTSTAPLVFGTRAGRDRAVGGGADRLLGFGFGPSGSAVSVTLGGSLASSGVVSNTTIDLTVPPGLDVHGNPLGAVALAVTASGGATGTREAAFEYTPSLSAPTTAWIGQPLCMRVETEPGATWFMNYGGTLPGTAIPVPPYSGALEIVSPVAVWPTPGSTADGHGTYVVDLPNDRSLIGTTIAFQASVTETTSPLSASFSNVVHVDVRAVGGAASPVRHLTNPTLR